MLCAPCAWIWSRVTTDTAAGVSISGESVFVAVPLRVATYPSTGPHAVSERRGLPDPEPEGALTPAAVEGATARERDDDVALRVRAGRVTFARFCCGPSTTTGASA